MKCMTGLILCGLLGAGVACADGRTDTDAVVDWNRITVDAVTAGRPRPDRHGRHRTGAGRGARCRAGASRMRFEPYLVETQRAQAGAPPPWPQLRTTCWSACIPAQAPTLDHQLFQLSGRQRPHRRSRPRRRPKGAARILPLRRVNPEPLPPPFVGSNDVGDWRPTPSFLGNPPVPAPFSPMAAPWMARLDPFTLTSPTRFRPEPPPALTSPRYTRDFNEVKAFGSLASTARSAEQTDLAYFYSGNIQRSGTARCVESRHDICAGPATRPGCSRSRTWQSPTP